MQYYQPQQSGLLPLHGYGTQQPRPAAIVKEHQAPLPLRQRRRVSWVGPLICLLVPSFLFTLVMWATCFSMRYQHRGLTIFIVILAAVFVVVCGINAFNERRLEASRLSHGMPIDSTWHMYLFVFSLLALLLGVLLGDLNYQWHMSDHYEYMNLNSYSDVDPAGVPGQQVMDAGRVDFMNGTVLDLDKSMGFRNLDTFCVAPMVVPNKPGVSYDYWAVGINCCTGGQNNYKCGEWSNARARSGLRLLDDTIRPFFRLAVQQAEASYKITSQHPLFFEWTEDANESVNQMAHNGAVNCMICVAGFFFLDLFCTVVFVMLHMKVSSQK